MLLVHGGAWAIPDDMAEAHLAGVRTALDAGWRVLECGGPALDAVEEAVVVMEDEETFDAGRGSFLTSDGTVQLDALMMDGGTLRAGGAGCLERIRNPIRLARKILEESPHIFLVSAGAERFAQEHGISLCDNRELVTERELIRLREAQAKSQTAQPVVSHDTVGAVALDKKGNLAAATSTGGTLNKTPGRIGDSSLIGCGCYADNESAAVSATGWGEPIMKLVLGKWAVDRVRGGVPPERAAAMAMDILKLRVGGHGGMILLDGQGRFGIAHNTARMAWGRKTVADEGSGVHC